MRTPQAKRPTRRETGAAAAVPSEPAAPESARPEPVTPPGIEWSDDETPTGRVMSVRAGETTYSETLDPTKPNAEAVKARLLARVVG